MSMEDFEFIKKKYGIKADEDQERAIFHGEGPALVLAGPGSGKTAVIVARCLFLLERMKSRKEAVLTVAFNKAAALEMKERFEKFYGRQEARAHFSTFHSFCNGIISIFERKTGQTFIRLAEGDSRVGYDKYKLLADIYRDINSADLSAMEINKLINEISCVKNGLPVEIAQSGSAFKALDRVIAAYEKYKRQHRLIDFDDMLYFARELLEGCPEILRELREKYKFVQVDEGQDLSEIQLEILKLLLRPGEQNLFIVGDDDQGIYGFRGAKPECILNIENYFKGCKIYRLERNYRSTKNIVDLAGKFISRNQKRYAKQHYTLNDIGPRPVCRVFFNDRELLEFIYAKISRKDSGSCGILFRNGISAILPAVFLLNKKIPFSVRKLRDSFFDHWMTRDIMKLIDELKINGYRQRPAKFLRRLLYDRDFREEGRLKSELLFQPPDIFDRLMEALLLLAENTASWDEFKDKFKLLEKFFREERDEGLRVCLSTVHAAKGLEYDSVFLIDLYKGEFPGKNSDYELEEERRLFFVGITRAKRNLYLLYPSRRAGRVLEAGRFFLELKELLKK